MISRKSFSPACLGAPCPSSHAASPSCSSCARPSSSPVGLLAAIDLPLPRRPPRRVTYQSAYPAARLRARERRHRPQPRDRLRPGRAGADFFSSSPPSAATGGGWSWTLVGSESPTPPPADGRVDGVDVRASARAPTPNDADLVFQVESRWTPPPSTRMSTPVAVVVAPPPTPRQRRLRQPGAWPLPPHRRLRQADFSLAACRATARNKDPLVMCVFYLAEFKTTAISQAALDRLQHNSTPPARRDEDACASPTPPRRRRRRGQRPGARHLDQLAPT